MQINFERVPCRPVAEISDEVKFSGKVQVLVRFGVKLVNTNSGVW